jgi:hypothetical protein
MSEATRSGAGSQDPAEEHDILVKPTPLCFLHLELPNKTHDVMNFVLSSLDFESLVLRP